MKDLNLKTKGILTMAIVFCLLPLNKTNAQTVLTLEKSLEIAAENSPVIKQSKLNLERSQYNLTAQEASLKSNFSLSLNPLDYSTSRSFNDMFSTWNTTENTSTGGSFNISQPIKMTDGTLSLTNAFEWRNSSSDYSNKSIKSYSNNLFIRFDQPIFTYNRMKMDLKELELDFETTTLSYAIQKLMLERTITQAFYSVFQRQMDLQIAQEEYNNQEINYNIIKNKVEGGLVAKEEEYQAELNLSTSKSSVQNAEVSLENTKDSFKELLGISLFDEIMILANVEHQQVDVDIDKAITNGLEQRMELRQREISIENSQFSLIRTSAMNEFRGNVSLSVGVIGDNENFGNIYETPTNNPRVSVSFQIPVYDWGEKKARIKAAESSIKTSELSLENEKNGIIIGVRTVCRNLKNNELQIDIARQRERIAQLTYNINQEKYKNGDITGFDLNQFQNQLSLSKTSYSNSLINYKIELLNLKIQSLWDFEKNTSYIPEDLQKMINKQIN
ncbi:TolC family protein [Bacteroidota bacterium]